MLYKRGRELLNRWEDCFCKVLFSALWNFICESTNQKVLWLKNSSYHHLISRYCVCPVGASDLCFHTFAFLLFLKLYAKMKENILALSCTEQLQKWHRPSRNCSLPMMSFREIKLKSTHYKKGLVHNTKFLQLTLK